jgi:hypothetical protein
LLRKKYKYVFCRNGGSVNDNGPGFLQKIDNGPRLSKKTTGPDLPKIDNEPRLRALIFQKLTGPDPKIGPGFSKKTTGPDLPRIDNGPGFC